MVPSCYVHVNDVSILVILHYYAAVVHQTSQHKLYLLYHIYYTKTILNVRE
jgi:hypothetical protein